jgi:hypothetical protein
MPLPVPLSSSMKPATDNAWAYHTAHNLSLAKKKSSSCLVLLSEGTDLQMLIKLIGNSAAAIERQCSKLTATMAADKLA